MSMSCKACRHPKVREINQMLVDLVPVRHIAEQVGDVSYRSIQRHKGHIAEMGARAIVERKATEGTHIVAQVQTAIDRIRKMSDACDDYLSHPGKVDTYFLGSRADELEVLYIKPSGAKEVKTLDHYIGLVEGLGGSVVRVKSRVADPRELILKASDSLHKYIETASRIADQMTEQRVKASASKEWRKVRVKILNVLDGYPEAKEAMLTALSEDI